MNTDNSEIGDKLIGDENNIVFYTDEEENVNVEVIMQNEKVWLNIESLTKLFKINRIGITRHINNIYKDEELEKIAHVQKLHIWVIMINNSILQNIII